MSEQECLELLAHVEELENAVRDLSRKSYKARYSHSRTHASGASSAYEIEAVWLRGFVKRCKDNNQ